MGAALSAADPAGTATFAANATAYKSRLDASVRARIATIPPTNRKLVAFDDASPYYARAYGITIVGVAVEAPGQDPGATYKANLIAAMRSAGVKAIFSERQFPPTASDTERLPAGARLPRAGCRLPADAQSARRVRDRTTRDEQARA